MRQSKVVVNKRPLTVWRILVFIFFVFAYGCAMENRAMIYQETVYGVGFVSRSDEKGGEAVVGYSRQSDSVVPKLPAKDGEGSQAMSVLLKNKVAMDMTGTVQVDQSFATGKKAEKIASFPEEMKRFVTSSGFSSR